MKYKTYEQLIEAYKSGDLTEPLIVDKDCMYVYVNDEQVFGAMGPHIEFHVLAASIGIPTDEARRRFL